MCLWSIVDFKGKFNPKIIFTFEMLTIYNILYMYVGRWKKITNNRPLSYSALLLLSLTYRTVNLKLYYEFI